MLFDDTGISGLCLDFTVSSYGIDWISTQKSHIAVNIANYRELSRMIYRGQFTFGQMSLKVKVKVKGALAEKRSEHKYDLISSRLAHPVLLFASPPT